MLFWLAVALFLRGLGWNLGFVAGSSLLTAAVPLAIRGRLQGRADTITWTSSALASLAGCVTLQSTDYRTVAYIGLAILATPVVIVLRNRRNVALAPT